MWGTVKIWKWYTKLQRILQCKFPLSAARKVVHSQLWLSILYVQPLWLYISIRRMYTRMNNPLNPFITAQEIIILISLSFRFYYWRRSERKILKKITKYCYTHPLSYPQMLAQSFEYSLKNRFPDYWLIILIFISFQFYYWRSNKRKILEKSVYGYIHPLSYTNFRSICSQ